MTISQILRRAHHDFSLTWFRLVNLDAVYSDPDRRRKARLLAAMSLLFAAISALSGLVWALLVPNTRGVILVTSSASLVLIAAYWLNRRHAYRLAAVLVVLTISGIAFLLALHDPQNREPFIYLLLSVLISSVILSFRTTLILAAANCLGILLTQIFFYRSFEREALSVLYVNIFGSFGILMTAYLRDVLEKDRQAEIITSANRYRNLMEQASDGILIHDIQGRCLDANPRFCAMLGYEREELLQMTLADLVIPEDYASQPIRIALLERGEELLSERRFRRKDGTVIPTESNTRRLTDGRVQSIIRDVSVRKIAENESLALRHALEQQVAERTAHLLAVNTELEAFSYSVSHDLRAPLRAIDGFTQALAEDCGDQLNDEAKQHLARVRAASQRMGTLIDALLMLSRIARIDVTYAEVDLSSIASEIVEMFRAAEPRRQVAVSIEPDIRVNGDSALLYSLMENLIGNAWKFTARAETPAITFGAVKEASRVVCFVRDNGVGFDMYHAEKLFTPFLRLHSDKQFSGTGVGLATVKRIIQRHGGSVWGESAVNAGATFFFSLPLPGGQ